MVCRHLAKIERALRVTNARRKTATVTNPGGYFRTLVNKKRGFDGRLVEFWRKLKPCMSGDDRLWDYDIANVVKDDPRPFYALKKVYQSIVKKEPMRRHPEDDIPADVFENEYNRLYRACEVGSRAYATKKKPKTGAATV